MDSTQEKNNRIIQDAINQLAKQSNEMRQRVQMLENEIVILKAEIANTKQMTGHILGRGMGSTVQ